MARVITWLAAGLLAGWCLVVVQTSFIQALPYPFSTISLVLGVTYVVVFLVDYPLGIASATWLGLLLEMRSPLAPGSMIIPLLLALVVVNFLFNLLFTNRSLYSLVLLSGLATVFFHLGHIVYQAAAWRFNISPFHITVDRLWLATIFWQTALTLLFVAGSFILLRFVSRRFHSAFLVGGRR